MTSCSDSYGCCRVLCVQVHCCFGELVVRHFERLNAPLLMMCFDLSSLTWKLFVSKRLGLNVKRNAVFVLCLDGVAVPSV